MWLIKKVRLETGIFDRFDPDKKIASLWYMSADFGLVAFKLENKLWL